MKYKINIKNYIDYFMIDSIDANSKNDLRLVFYRFVLRHTKTLKELLGRMHIWYDF